MRIRKSRLEDAAELARLHRGTIRTVNSKDYSSEDIAVWSARPTAERMRRSHSITIRYVAVEKEKILGFIDVRKDDPEKLWHLYVHKDWIGRGVGTKLLQKIEETAKSLHVKRLEANSTVTAQKFYASQGFTVLRRERHPMGNRRLNVVVMEKHLLK